MNPPASWSAERQFRLVIHGVINACAFFGRGALSAPYGQSCPSSKRMGKVEKG
jgi:hypothetical protein